MKTPHYAAIALVLIVVSAASPILAAMQTVSGVGEYRMGDYETKQEAVRLATEAAKRNVLEQVATYVDSMTVAKWLAEGIGMPYQNLINLYLRDCALNQKKLDLRWAS